MINPFNMHKDFSKKFSALLADEGWREPTMDEHRMLPIGGESYLISKDGKIVACVSQTTAEIRFESSESIMKSI